MSDPEKSYSELANALSVVGSITATIIAVAMRVARREAKKIVPEECEAHQECAALRITALTMMTNGLLILAKTTEASKRKELIDENIKFAKFLIEEGDATTKEDEDTPTEKEWLSDEQLKQMFKGAD